MSEPAFPHPLLICDIGGTNVRVAEVARPGERARATLRFATDEAPSLAEALRARFGDFSAPPASMILCAAGPIEGRSVRLTNADWTLDGPDIARALDLRQGLLLNDFEAQAVMLAHLRTEDARPIGPARPEAQETPFGARLVLGPGTGLGAALLLPWGGRFLPLTTEAGHMDVGPASDFEAQLWPAFRRAAPRVTGETLLSGRGLALIHRSLCEVEGAEPATDDPALITARAFEARDGVEAHAVRLFWRFTARVAGGLALGLLARGGVTLSGGILPRIVDFLDEDAFRQAFEDQAPLGAVVERIPTRLVTDGDAVLDGLAALAAEPGRFMIDYEARLWR